MDDWESVGVEDGDDAVDAVDMGPKDDGIGGFTEDRMK